MKFSYLFAAILACNAIGAVTGGRGTKSALAVVSAALALYGLIRIVG
jgi:hypothetical protein